ncbi:translesion DNA synthesis-associated protein ImuA [Thioalkalivibrio paradoxus]|uniref:SOS cell division inhibitor SulA n=1 Tax=Thioalkalivibrio paradoxus ARh 1 TaxID=713585 RepID=W0DI26_9GAMM|nr:translesion DNA synthesis-associated protein ImuA [Thioalkalivibrio paradoxus]AHE98066.1 SOS cell division inhibitor SulA [Thioalkalivibrio paradoxus ARh 1]
MTALEELLSHPRIWRGNAAGTIQAPVRPSGIAALDQALRGGWPQGQLIELIGSPFGSGETRLLLPMLAACAREHRRIVLVAPPATPWTLGWRQLGVEPERILLIRAGSGDDAVWCCEQLLRSPGTGALLAWLRDAGSASLRRLRLAAASAHACGFVYRPAPAARQPSPAHLRIHWQARQEHLYLRILKCTGGIPPQERPIRVSPAAWNRPPPGPDLRPSHPAPP